MKSMIKLIALYCLFVPLNLFAQTWEQAATLPGQARHHPVTFSIGNFGYLLTGSTNSKDFYRYDPAADAWEQLTDFPGNGRGFSYGVSFDGKGYVGFGRAAGVNYADLWEYDPATEQWTELASLPGAGRAHPALIAGSGKIWMGLGSGESGNMNDWWEYDIASDTWEQQANFPSFNRHHPYYFAVDGVPYVGFGHGADIYNDFYKFDFENDSWITLNPFPDQGRVAGTQFSHGSKGYILSGQGEDHGDLLTGEFWEYDPEDDSWTALIPHPGGGRWAPGSFVIDEDIFLMCGNQENSGNKNDMWRGDLPALPVATNELIRKAEIKVSPNPTRDYIQFETEVDLAADAIIELINLEGKTVMTLNPEKGQTVDIGHLPGGVYTLKLFNPKYAKSVRFVISR